MATTFELQAKTRTDMGKGASRRLRRLEDLVPGIVYGAGKDPHAVSMSHNEMLHALDNEAVYSHILTLHVD